MDNKLLTKNESTEAGLPTEFGDFYIKVYKENKGNEPVALIAKKLDISKPVLVRVHSECLTGDAFGSLKCDCGEQKNESLRMIAKNGNGIFIYLRQEGRGIGLYEKIKAYKIQEQGYDTHEANIMLGHKPDQREYSWVKAILDDLGVDKIKIITNNPSKVSEISSLGITVVDRIPLVIKSNKHNRKYFETKKKKFKHFFGAEQSNYFYQFSYVENAKQAEEIGEFLKNRKNDPLLKICLGVYFDSNMLDDSHSINNAMEIFKAAELYTGFVPILHYTFKYSKDPVAELKSLKKVAPFVHYIQLNDLNRNSLEVLKFACKYWLVDFPLSDDNFDISEDKEFIKTVRLKKVFVLLDNSHGKGIKESRDSYLQKIQTLFDRGLNDIALYGGFGPDNLDTYFELKNYFKVNFSIDAESQLKTNGHLDIDKVKKYLVQLISHNSEK